MPAAPARPRNKTVATWLAFLFGSLGAHRYYLHGLRDPWGWLHVPPSLLGLWGVLRMLSLGQDDRLAWLLIPLLGLSLSAGMLAAILYGLMPEERWDARYGGGGASHWLTVFGVVGALMVGATVLIATIAFSGQRYFEAQIEGARQLSQ